jgi:hypothetical protein
MNTFSKIKIDFIPHEAHRYSTVGDWFWDSDGVLNIKVSRLPNDPQGLMSLAIAIHELTEVGLCVQKGITQEEVDKFDFAYEKTRPEGDDSEPGDHPEAPYRDQHCFATAAERMFIAACGIPWEDYAKAIESLPEVPDQSLTG